MDNPEFRLISKIVDKKDLRTPLKLKIRAEHFGVPQAQQMFAAIWKFYHATTTAGQVPTRRWMQHKFQGFEIIKHNKDSIESLCEEVRQGAMMRRLQEMVEVVDPMIAVDPYKALEHMRSAVLDTQGLTASSRDMYLHEAGNELIRQYDLVKSSVGIMGVPWPWDRLNDETNGMMPEDFIVIYGRMKSMKTFVGCYVAAHAYYEANRRVLLYSAEMSPTQILNRIVAAIVKIDYKSLRLGKLNLEDEMSFKDMLQHVGEDEIQTAKRQGKQRALLVTSDKDDSRGIGGVGHIEMKAEEFEPDLIIVDSYYRLRDERSGKNDYDWKVQASIAQDLKHLAQRLQLPVIGITQANRASIAKEVSEGMEDVSYTDATGQEADLGLRVVKGFKTPLGRELKVIIAAAREIEPYGFSLLAKPFTRFDFQGWIEPPAEDDLPKPRAHKIKDKVKEAESEKQSQRELASQRKAIASIAEQVLRND